MRRRPLKERILSLLLAGVILFTTFGSDVVTVQAAEISSEVEVTEDVTAKPITEEGNMTTEGVTEEVSTEAVTEEVNTADITEEISTEVTTEEMSKNSDTEVQTTEQTTASGEEENDAQEKKTEETSDVSKEQEESVAFLQKKVIDQVEIKVEAPKGVFPVDATLVVKKITDKKTIENIEDKVEDKVEEEKEDVTLEEMLLFDVSIMDTKGDELQPDQSKGNVTLTFSNVDADEKKTEELQVFHVSEEKEEVELLNTKDDVEEGTAEAKVEHFSTYGVALLSETPSEGKILINGKSFTDGTYTIAYGDKMELSLNDTVQDRENATFWYITDQKDPDKLTTQWTELSGESVFYDGQYCILEPGVYYLTYQLETGAIVRNGNHKLTVTPGQIAPAEVSWNDKTATWKRPTTTVTGGYLAQESVNSNYDITVYNREEEIIDNSTFSSTNDSLTYEESGKIESKGYGTYYFTITTKSLDTTHYIDSEPSKSEDLVYKDTIEPIIESYEIEDGKLKGTAIDKETGIYAYAFSTETDVSKVQWNAVAKNEIKKNEAVSFTDTPEAVGKLYFYVKDAGDTVAKSTGTFANTAIVYHGYSYSSGQAKDKNVKVLGNEAITQFDTPSRSGYVFGGWYRTQNSAEQTTAVTSIPEEQLGTTVDLYAKWVKKDFAISLSASETLPKTYDGTQTTLTANITNNTEASAISYEWYKDDNKLETATTDTYKVKNVADSGTYKVKATLTIDDGEQVILESASLPVTINPKSLVIGVKDPKTTYGENAPEYEFTYNSFATGDDASVVTKGSVSCTYQKWDSQGTYPITLSGFSSPNYNISYEDNMNLTVSPKDADEENSGVEMTLETEPSEGYIYIPGTIYEPEVTVTDTTRETDNKVLVKDTDYRVEYKNNSIAGTAEVNVIFQGNYTGTITKTFEIKKSTYEVQAHIIGWKYGDFSEENAPTFTVTGIDTGIVETKDVTYFYREKTGGEQYSEWSKVRPEDAGEYQVYAHVAELGNYTAQDSQPVDFSITKRTIILQTKSGSWSYNGHAHSELEVTRPKSITLKNEQGEDVVYEADDFAGTDDFLSVSASETITNVSESPKTNKIVAVLMSSVKESNYNIIKDEGTLEVTPVPLAVPGGVQWSNEEPGTASWLAVSRPNVEVEYHVALYRLEGGKSTLIKPENGTTDYFTTTDVNYDFKEIIRNDAGTNGVASYWFKVQAVPVGGTNKDNYAASSYSEVSTQLYTGKVELGCGEGVASAVFDDYSAETMAGTNLSENCMILLAGEKQSVTVCYQTGYSRISEGWVTTKNASDTGDVSFTLTDGMYLSHSTYQIALSSDITVSSEYEAVAKAGDDVPYASISFDSYRDNYKKARLSLYMYDSKKLTSFCMVRVEKSEDYNDTLRRNLEADTAKWTSISAEDDTSYVYNWDVDGPGCYYVGVKDDGGHTVWATEGITVYQLKFAQNQGSDFTVSGEMFPILKVKGQDIEALPENKFTSEGAAFTGWQGEQSGKMIMNQGKYTENRSETLLAKWNTTQYTYKVNYYYMNTEGEYPDSPSDTVEFKSFAGIEVKSTDATISKNLTGLSLDEDKGDKTITINAEGQEMNLYYKRANYAMTYSYKMPDDAISTVWKTVNYYYGQEIPALNDVPAVEGYEFGGWIYDGAGDRPEKMPNHAVAVEGSFSAKATTYQVNYYGENLAGDAYSVELDKETKNALHNKTITFSTTSEDAKEIDGFRVVGVTVTKGAAGSNNATDIADSAKGTVSVLEGETLQVNYFYERKTYRLTLNVTKHNEENESGDEQVYEAYWEYKYQQPFNATDFIEADKFATYYENFKAGTEKDVDSPKSFTDNTDSVDLSGYTMADFKDWSTGDAPLTMPAGNVTVSRTFIKDVQAEYRVKVYLQNEKGEYTNTPAKTLKFFGSVGSTVSVGDSAENTVKVSSFTNLIDGFSYYTFDSDNENSKLSGTVVKSVNADGSDMLTLSVYFERKVFKAKINYYYGNKVDNSYTLLNNSKPFKTEIKEGCWGNTFDCEPLKYFESENGLEDGNLDINFKTDGYVVVYSGSYTINGGTRYPVYRFTEADSLTSGAYKTAPEAITKFGQTTNSDLIGTTINVYYINPEPENHFMLAVKKDTKSNLTGTIQYKEEGEPTTSVDVSVTINGTTYSKVYIADKASLYEHTYSKAEGYADYPGAACLNGINIYAETPVLKTGFTDITETVHTYETKKYGACSTYEYYTNTAGNLYVMINDKDQLFFGNRYSISLSNEHSVVYQTVKAYADSYKVSDDITGIYIYNTTSSGIKTGNMNEPGTLTYNFRRKYEYRYYHNVLGNTCTGHAVAEGSSVSYEQLSTCATTVARPGYDLAIYKDSEYKNPLTKDDVITSMNGNMVYYGNYVRSKIPYHKYAHYELADQEGEDSVRFVTKEMITDSGENCYFTVGGKQYTLTKTTGKVKEETIADGTGQIHTFDVNRTTYFYNGTPVLADETWYTYSFTSVTMQQSSYGQTNFQFETTNTDNVLNKYFETKAVDLHAYYALETYTLTVDPKNSDTSNATKTTYRAGERVEVLAPSREGYTFARWKWTPDSAPSFENNANGTGIVFTMPAKDISMEAEWSAGNNNYEIEHYFQTPTKQYKSAWLSVARADSTTKSAVSLVVDGSNKTGLVYDDVTGDDTVCVSYTEDDKTYYYTSTNTNRENETITVNVTESDLFAIVEKVFLQTGAKELFETHKQTPELFTFSNAVCNSKKGVETDKSENFTVTYGMNVAYYYTRIGNYNVSMVAKASDNGEVSATLTSAGETTGMIHGQSATVIANVDAGYSFVGWYRAADVLEAAQSEGDTLATRKLKADWKSKDKLAATSEYTFDVTSNVELVAVVEPTDISDIANRTTVTLSSEKREYEYGYAADTIKNIEAAVQLPENADSAVYIVGYQWTLAGSDKEITEKSSGYKFPAGCGAGTYTYNCEVTIGRKDNGRTATVEAKQQITITVGQTSFCGGSTSYTGTYDGQVHGIRAYLVGESGLKEGTDYEIYYSDNMLTDDNIEEMITKNKAFRETVEGDTVTLPSEMLKTDVNWNEDGVQDYVVYYYIKPIGSATTNYTGYGSHDTVRINPKTISLQAKNTFVKTFDGSAEVKGNLTDNKTDKYRLAFGDDTTKYYDILGLVTDVEKDNYVLDFTAVYNSCHVQDASLITLNNITLLEKTGLSKNHNYQFNKTELSVSGRIDPKEINMTWEVEAGDNGIKSTDENGVISIQYTYNGKVHTPQAKLNETIEGLTLTQSVGQTNVGTDYKSVATITGDNTETSDYKLSQENCMYSIAGNSLKVAAVTKTETYNQSSHTLDEFTLTLQNNNVVNIKSGETFEVDGITYKLLCDTVFETDEKTKSFVNAGTYSMVPNHPQIIRVGTGVNVTDNFAITNTAANLIIHKKEITVGGITAKDKAYDGNTDAQLVFASTYDGLMEGDSLSLDENLVTGTFDGKDIGTHNVKISIPEEALIGTSKDNYILKFSDNRTQTLSVTAKITGTQLELKPCDITMTYGDSVPCKTSVVAGLKESSEQDVTVSGSITYKFENRNTHAEHSYTYTLKGTETLADLMKNEAATLGEVPYESLKLDAGTYTLTMDVSGLTTTNYTIVTTQSATVTVNQREVTISAIAKENQEPPLSKEYDGTISVSDEQKANIATNAAKFVTFTNVLASDSVGFATTNGFDAVYDNKNVKAGTYEGAESIVLTNMKLSNANYKLAEGTTSLSIPASITPKELYLEPKAVSVVYGSSFDTSKCSYTATGMVTVGGTTEAVEDIVESVDYTTTYQNDADSDKRNVGKYNIEINNIVLKTGNYTATCVNGENKLTVTKKKVKVRVQPTQIAKDEGVYSKETDDNPPHYKMGYGKYMQGKWFQPEFEGFAYEEDKTVLENINKEYDVCYEIQFGPGSGLEDLSVKNAESAENATSAIPHIAGNFIIHPQVEDVLSAKNYEFESETNSILEINKIQLTLAAGTITIKDKVYDGTKKVSENQIICGTNEHNEVGSAQYNYDYFKTGDTLNFLQSWDAEALRAAKSTGLVFDLDDKKTYYASEDVKYNDSNEAVKQKVTLSYDLNDYMKARYEIVVANSQKTAESAITPKDLEIAAQSAKILYAGQMPTFTNVYTSFAEGEDVTVLKKMNTAPTAGKGQTLITGENGEYWLMTHKVENGASRSDVASYDVEPTGFVVGTNNINGNYKLTYKNATLTVEQAKLDSPDVSWVTNKPGIVSFTGVSAIGDVKVDHYSMQLFKVSQGTEELEKKEIILDSQYSNVTPEKKYNLLETIRSYGVGKYMVEVTAHPSETNNQGNKNVADSAPGKSKVIYATNVVYNLNTDTDTTDAKEHYPSLMSLTLNGSTAQTTVEKVSGVFVEGETVPITLSIKGDAATGYCLKTVSSSNTLCTIPKKAEVFDKKAVTRTYENTITLNSTDTNEASLSAADTTNILVTLESILPQIKLTLSVPNQIQFPKEDGYIFANNRETYLKYGYTSYPTYKIEIHTLEDGVDVSDKYSYKCKWYMFNNGISELETVDAVKDNVTYYTTYKFPSGQKVSDYLIGCEITATRTDKNTKVVYGSDIDKLLDNNELFETYVTKADFNASVDYDKKLSNGTTYGWKYGEIRGVERINTTIIDATFTPVYYYSDQADIGGSWNATGAPSQWTKTKPTDAGTWYVRAYIPQTENYNEYVTEATEFVIEQNKLASPTDVELKVPSDDVPYGTLVWNPVASIVENGDTLVGVNHESFVNPSYKVIVSRKNGDSWNKVGTYENTQNNTVISETSDGRMTVNIADSLTVKGEYQVQVIAVANSSNGKQNCLDSEPTGYETSVDGEITVANNVYSKVYDGSSIVLNADYSGITLSSPTYQWFKDGKKISGATESTYSVTNVLESGDYFCVTTDNGEHYTTKHTVTISKRPLVVTAKYKTISYKDAAANDGVSYGPKEGETASGFAGEESETVLSGTLQYKYVYKDDDTKEYSNAASDCSPVGEYNIIVSGLSADNYKMEYVPGVMTVNPIADTITVTPKALTDTTDTVKIYDGTSVNENMFTVTRSGNGDLTFKYYKKKESEDAPEDTALESAPSEAGSYYVEVVEAAKDNYVETTSAKVPFTIGKKAFALSVTAKDMVYNNKAVTPEDLFTVTGNEGLEALQYTYYKKQAGVSEPEETALAEAPKNAGDYYVEVSVAANTNYAGAVSSKVPFCIQKRPLVITAKDKTIDYKGEAANDGVTYSGKTDDAQSGFADNESEETGKSDLEGTLTYTYKDSEDNPYTTASPAGTYRIIPSGFTSSNYDIEYKEGVLTVNAINDTSLSIVPKEIVYDKTSVSEDDFTITKTGTGEVTLSYYKKKADGSGPEETALSNPPADAGDYYVVATLAADNNYMQTQTDYVAFTIIPADITEIIFEDDNLKSGTPNPYFVYDQNAHVPASVQVKAIVNSAKETLTESDYDLVYCNENDEALQATQIVKVGTYTVKVTGKGNYKGTLTKKYEIKDEGVPVITLNDVEKSAIIAPENGSYCGDTTILVEDQNLTKVKISVKDGDMKEEATLDCELRYTYTLEGTAEGVVYEITATDVSGNTTTKEIRVYDKHQFVNYVETTNGLTHTAPCSHNCGTEDTRAILRGTVDWEYEYDYEEDGQQQKGVQGVDARATYAKIELEQSKIVNDETVKTVIATQMVDCHSTCGTDETNHSGTANFEFTSYEDQGTQTMLPMEDAQGNLYTYSVKVTPQKKNGNNFVNVQDYVVAGPERVTTSNGKESYAAHISYAPSNFELPWVVTLENLPKDASGNVFAPTSVNVKVMFAYNDAHESDTDYAVISQQTNNNGVECTLTVHDGSYTYSGSYPVWKCQGGDTTKSYYHRIQVVGYTYNGRYYDVSESNPPYRSICDEDHVHHTVYYDANHDNGDGTKGAPSGTVEYTISNLTMPIVVFDKNEGNDITNAASSSHEGKIIKNALGATVTEDEIAEANPTRNHYEFLGWFDKAEGGNKITKIDSLIAPVTLYAHWKELIKPSGKITVNTNDFDTLATGQNFDIYEKEKLSVTITAEDTSIENGEDTHVENSGIDNISYCVTSEEIQDFVSEAESLEWTAYNESFDLSSDGKYIIYSRIADKAGNITYLATDGIVLDTKLPKIEGVTSDTTYCAAQTITVTDTNLDTITVNGTEITLEADGTYTLVPSTTPYEIVATDKAGNTTTISNVKVNDGHTWSYAGGDTSKVTATCSVATCDLHRRDDMMVIMEAHSDTYNGNVFEATVTKSDAFTAEHAGVVGEITYYQTTEKNVTSGGTKLQNKPVSAGNYYAEAKITAASGAEVYVKKAFEILAVELDSVTLEENSFVYTGEQVGPSEIKVYAMVNGTKTLLTKDVDYTITENETSKEVTKAIRAGEYIVKVTGKGNFKGTVSETYTIGETGKPVVTGIENGGAYCENKTITITDANLSTVKITKKDGSLVKEETNLTDYFTYTLVGTSEGTTYTVTATDESGNTNETMTVTVYDDHSFTDYKLAEDKHSKTADCDHNCGETHTITLVSPVGTLVVNQAEYQGIAQDTENVHYMKENLNVSVKVEEPETGSNVENTQVATIQYVLLESAVDIVSKDHAGEITWSTYKTAFDVVEDGIYVVYIKIIDEVENVEYISTEKYVIDHKAPKIAGVESGKTYCEQQTITITDTNLDTITVNGDAISLEADGTYTLAPSDTPYEIVATDKAGNKTTVSNVKVNAGHTYKNPVITWSEDFQRATATFECEIDNTHEKLVLDCEVTRELTKEATGTESGKITYTAKVKFNGEEYDDQKDKETNITDLKDENGNSIATEVYVAPDVPKTIAKNMNVNTALAILEGEGKENLTDNSDILMYLEIQNADQTVPQIDKGLVEDLICTMENTDVGTYLDISLYLKVNQEKPEKLSDTYGNKITLTVDIPEKLKNTNPKLERTYSIVRVHSGKSELLNTVYDKEKNTLTFETDRFSTYAIVFTDQVIEEEKPPVEEPENPPVEEPENPPTTTENPPEDSTKVEDGELEDTDDLDAIVSKAAQEKNELALNAGLKVSQTGSIINIAWGKVSDADGYNVYVQYCGLKFNSKSLNSVNSGKVTKIKVKKVNGKKLDLKKNYKIYVVAYKLVNGKKVTLGKTIAAHIVGKNNTKYTNVKAVKVTKSSYSLKVGGTATIKAKTVLVQKNKNQLSDAHAKEFRYASSNKKVATVSTKGKITAVAKGTCTIYVYARNGYAKKVKVTVK